MSDEPIRISDLPEFGENAFEDDDLGVFVDVSDTSEAASGTTKSFPFEQVANYVYDKLVSIGVMPEGTTGDNILTLAPPEPTETDADGADFVLKGGPANGSGQPGRAILQGSGDGGFSDVLPILQPSPQSSSPTLVGFSVLSPDKTASAIFAGEGEGGLTGSRIILIQDKDGTLALLSDVRTLVTLTDGATVDLDASLGTVFYLDATDDRAINVPTNPRFGQKIVIRHFADGGDRTLTLDPAGFRFGSDITELTATIDGTTDYIGCVWNEVDNIFDIVAYAKGYASGS